MTNSRTDIKKHYKNFFDLNEIGTAEDDELHIDWATDLVSSLLLHYVSHSGKPMWDNMQYYMEYCQRNGYVTPKEWIEKHKHF